MPGLDELKNTTADTTAVAVDATTAASPASEANIIVARTGDVREVPFRDGMTAKDALADAGFTLDGACEIRLNNKPCKDQAGTLLVAGDQIMILGKIRGA